MFNTADFSSVVSMGTAAAHLPIELREKFVGKAPQAQSWEGTSARSGCDFVMSFETGSWCGLFPAYGMTECVSPTLVVGPDLFAVIYICLQGYAIDFNMHGDFDPWHLQLRR